MGKRRTWVLDTETKGTGAEMVPLERLEERKRLRERREPARIVNREAASVREEITPDAESEWVPRRFRLVDVMSREPLAEDVGLTEALRLLGQARSLVDVLVYLWEPADEDWRPATLAERRMLWDARESAAAA
jgi:hypothetical protein